MGCVKKRSGSYGRLYEKAMSRPGIRELVEKYKQRLKTKAIVGILRAQPPEPIPPPFDDKFLHELMLAQALEDGERLSERQALIAQKARKGISQKLLLNAADRYAKEQWDAGLPIRSRGWRQSIATDVGVRWRTVKNILPGLDLSEEDLIERMRRWKPKK